jgi:transcription-repair coupling factor (superfamily II helicase)
MLDKLLQLHQDNPKAREITESIAKGARLVQIEGLAAAAKSWMIAGLFDQTKRTILLVTYTYEQAERIAEDLPFYGIPRDQVLFYPPSDAMIYEEGAPNFSVIGERMGVLQALATGRTAIVVAPINAALRRTMPRHILSESCMSVKVGEELDMDDFIEKLVKMGYERTDVVDRHGEFSRRGGMIDVYASSEDDPLRIELFGDEIESIRHFDSASQRSIDKIETALLLPAREVLMTEESSEKAVAKIRKELASQIESLDPTDPDSSKRLAEKVADDITRLENLAYFDEIEFYLPYLHPEEVSLFDYIPADAIVALDEPMQIKSHWEQHEEKMLETLINRAGKGLLLASQKRQHVSFEATIKHSLAGHQGLSFTLLPRPVAWAKADHEITIESKPMDSFSGHVDAAMDQVKTWMGNGQLVILASGQDKRMLEILSEFGIVATQLEDSLPSTLNSQLSTAFVAHAPLRSGYKLPDAGFVVLTDSEIFGTQRMHRARKASHEGIPISSVLDLKEGDYIVHISHGIGYYRGIVKLKSGPPSSPPSQGGARGGVEREYLLLEYAANDKLYVPSEQIDRVQKYIGGEGTPPTVHRLGGSEWMRTTARVKKAVQEMARELIELYAWRQALGGHAYGPDTPWQQEMESAFPFNETPDQLGAIHDVKHDLELTKPMDRLICGDVGYGKTEVAIRAAFKVISEGRQAAILCPTTVLAQQHFNTFSERLAAFPITVDMLSRFRTAKEQKATVEGIKFGTVDVVIGTHRLLSKDIEFKDLGLIVIDEEQRFGVKHKEKLKVLRKTVDVLTMTATPIPRTLHMSLSGIRDMSIINDPPEGRMPIKTIVKEAEASAVREAIVRELDRGGQIFFVHNRVENIGHVADQVQKLVPYARVDTAHGQMAESELERVMMDFYEHKFDVLVCTTIIESGLDIPNANTIVINDSDKLGLAQLYQLRGRVGRSDRQAYAYLLYKPDKMLTEVAEKRLDAIREFTDLGSGYRIAMRDLEIRGAGNLLGAEQSGQMAAVGFDLYCQLLQKAVSELKGEEVEEIELPPVELPIDAFIPQGYIPAEAHRILFYKKMAAVKNTGDVQAVQDELEDRFGDPPKPVWNMLAIIRLRLRCHQLGIASISTFRNQIQVTFGQGVRLTPELCNELMKTHRRHWFQPDKLAINPSTPRVISEVEDMIEVLAGAFRRMGAKVG